MSQTDRKPMLTDKVIRGLVTALGAIEAGPPEAAWTAATQDDIATATAWARGMRDYRARKRAANGRKPR